MYAGCEELLVYVKLLKSTAPVQQHGAWEMNTMLSAHM